MNRKNTFSLFEVIGLELEYMIVDEVTLEPKPIADQLFLETAGHYCNEVAIDCIAWSNELVAHVIELKTNGPSKLTEDLASHFHENIIKINDILAKFQAKLMPTGAHPWFDPSQNVRLWPHGNKNIYQAYDEIFGCSGHGFANLQCVHINLPFANDEEFARLHTAIRLLLPIMSALTASTPIIEGALTPYLDTRLNYYAKNQSLIPEISGDIIPEVVESKIDYCEQILQPMYKAIAPYDKQNLLQEEWLNSRAAIARFDRNAIEIRILDIQECPLADIAVARLIVEVLKGLVEERWASYSLQKSFTTAELYALYRQVILNGKQVLITNPIYLSALGISKDTATVGEVWQSLFNQLKQTFLFSQENTALELILQQGSLAERITNAFSPQKNLTNLMHIYRNLCQALADNRQFVL